MALQPTRQASAPAPFVVGASRSGTTLLRLMLDASSKLAIPPETNFGQALDAFERGGVTAGVDAILQSQAWGDCDLSTRDLQRSVEDDPPNTQGELLRRFYELYALHRGKPRWGDKSPYYMMAMERIAQLFPEAHFVHVIRDGRDVALSNIPLWFGPDTIEKAAVWWSQMIALARRQAAKLPFYMEVRYEELVRDPRAALTAVCEFIELEWEEGMLDYHLHAADRLAAETADLIQGGRLVSRRQRLEIHRLVDRPPQVDRVGRWRTEMSEDDRRTFERIAGITLEELGYETAGAPL